MTIRYLPVNFKNSNTPYFYSMMLATIAASNLPFFFYRIIFYNVVFVYKITYCFT